MKRINLYFKKLGEDKVLNYKKPKMEHKSSMFSPSQISKAVHLTTLKSSRTPPTIQQALSQQWVWGCKTSAQLILDTPIKQSFQGSTGSTGVQASSSNILGDVSVYEPTKSIFSLVPPIQPGSFIGPTEHLKSAHQIIEMATIATNCRPSTPSQERQERWLIRRQRRGPATTQKQPFIIVTTTLVALLLCYSSTAPKSRLASKSSKKRFQARSPPKVSQRLGRWPCGRHWSQGQWWWHWWQQFQCHHNKNCYKHSKPHWNNNI